MNNLQKQNLINKISNINSNEILNILFLIFKSNNVKYIEVNNNLYIDFNQPNIDNKLLTYIDNFINDYKPYIKRDKIIKEKSKLEYNIDEYLEIDRISYKINKFKQIKIIKQKTNNSNIYNNIMKLLNMN